MKKQAKKQLKKGFSLIELMVVVLIIGVIAAMGFPMYTKFKSSTEDSAAEQTARSLRNAVLTKDAAGATLADGDSDLDDYTQGVVDNDYYFAIQGSVWCIAYKKDSTTALASGAAGDTCINQDGTISGTKCTSTTGVCT